MSCWLYSTEFKATSRSTRDGQLWLLRLIIAGHALRNWVHLGVRTGMVCAHCETVALLTWFGIKGILFCATIMCQALG